MMSREGAVVKAGDLHVARSGARPAPRPTRAILSRRLLPPPLPLLRAFLVAILLGGSLASTSALAEIATIDVFFDLDQDTVTGCEVVTVDGTAEGAEMRVRTLFDVGTETVLSTTTATCADPLLDLFGGEAPVASAPPPTWTGVLGNGAAGSMLIESHVPVAALGSVSQARAFVVVNSMVGEDALLEGEGSAPLVVSLAAAAVPGLGVVGVVTLFGSLFWAGRSEIGRRVLSSGGVALLLAGALFVPNPGMALLGEGLQRNWLISERVDPDPEGDAPIGIDLVDFYAAFNSATNELWLRVDVLFGAPVCLDWGFVDPGAGYACGMQPPLDQGPFFGAVAMTFDDGPHTIVTPQVLATLRAHGIPATFFVVGNRLNTPAEIALAVEIHQDPLFRIANHSLTHRRMPNLTPEEIEIEVEANSDKIRDAIGDPCYFEEYFRFPFAASNCITMTAARSHGLASAAVHINTSDWCYGTNGGVCPENVVPFILDEFRDDLPGWAVHGFQESGGGILVMHDIHNNTAAQLPAVIAGLQAAGATFVDLGDSTLFPIMNSTIVTPEAPACCSGVIN